MKRLIIALTAAGFVFSTGGAFATPLPPEDGKLPPHHGAPLPPKEAKERAGREMDRQIDKHRPDKQLEREMDKRHPGKELDRQIDKHRPDKQLDRKMDKHRPDKPLKGHMKPGVKKPHKPSGKRPVPHLPGQPR